MSTRTIRRDIERSRDLGYPVQATMGAVGGYRLTSAPPCHHRRLRIAAAQAVVMLAAAAVESERLRFGYQSADATHSWRLAEPYRLTCANAAGICWPTTTTETTGGSSA